MASVVLYRKTLFVLLAAILATSWVPEGRRNGLAFACSSSVKPPQLCVENKIPTNDDIPREHKDITSVGDVNSPAGVWAGKTYYKLPNAPLYILEIAKGADSTIHPVSNPYYK